MTKTRTGRRVAARRADSLKPRTSGPLTYRGITVAMERELIARAQAGDNDAAATLIQAHEPLLIERACAYKNRGVPWDDLMQCARIGFLDGIMRFDPSHEKRLTTYAIYRVVHELGVAVAETGSAIRQTSTLYDKLSKVRTGAEPDTDETRALRRLMSMSSLDVTLPGTPDPWVETKPSDMPDPESLLAEADSAAARMRLIRSALHASCMSEGEREVIERRYLVEDPETLEAIAVTRGRTRERIRQIEEAAIDKIGRALRRMSRVERIDMRGELC